MTKNELQKRLKTFSVNCFHLTSELPKNQGGKYIQGQLIRSSMSAYANYRAACIGQSRAAFVAKLSIALEEADESNLWLDMIIETQLIEKEAVATLYKESAELASILAAARRSSQ